MWSGEEKKLDFGRTRDLEKELISGILLCRTSRMSECPGFSPAER